MKKIALYAGLVLLGSTLGAGSVYGASKYVQALPSTYSLVVNVKDAGSGLPELIYQGKPYIQVASLLSHLQGTSISGFFMGKWLNLNDRMDPTTFLSAFNKAVAEYQNVSQDLKNVDFTADQTTLGNDEHTLSSDIYSVENTISTTSDWDANTSTDKQIKETMVNLLALEETELYLMKQAVSDFIVNSNSQEQNLLTARQQVIDEENSLINQLGNFTKQEGWTSKSS